jgi:hypothetical protein
MPRALGKRPTIIAIATGRGNMRDGILTETARITSPLIRRMRLFLPTDPILPRDLDAANRSSSSLARTTGVPSFAIGGIGRIARRQLRRAPP